MDVTQKLAPIHFAGLQDHLDFQFSSIPFRDHGALIVLTKDQKDAELLLDNPCLSQVLDAVAYLFKNDAFLEAFIELTYTLTELFERSPPSRDESMHRLKQLLAENGLPKIVVEDCYAESGDVIYGFFDPSTPHEIRIDKAFVQRAKVVSNTPKQLKIAFILLIKIIHEMAHWIIFHLMKGRDKKVLTPPEFGEEAGEYIEKMLVGKIVYHHNVAVSRIWDIDEVLVETKTHHAAAKQAIWLHVEFMRSWFDKNLIDSRRHHKEFNSKPGDAGEITSPRLTSSRPVSTSDEFPQLDFESSDASLIYGLDPRGNFYGKHDVKRSFA